MILGGRKLDPRPKLTPVAEKENRRRVQFLKDSPCHIMIREPGEEGEKGRKEARYGEG